MQVESGFAQKQYDDRNYAPHQDPSAQTIMGISLNTVFSQLEA